MKLTLYFSEDEMRGFLLSRGYVVQVIEEVDEVNEYQNVFTEHVLLMEYAIKDGKKSLLHHAFQKEMKHKLLMV